MVSGLYNNNNNKKQYNWEHLCCLGDRDSISVLIFALPASVICLIIVLILLDDVHFGLDMALLFMTLSCC